MKYLTLIIMAALISSCASQKRCVRKYPPAVSSDTVYYFTVRDSIVYRDTTIVITLPGQTVIDSILISEGTVTTPPVILETDLARAEAYYKTPKVYLKLIQKDTTIYLRLDNALKSSYYWKSQYFKIINSQVQKEKYIPQIYKIALWGWIGALVLIIFVVAVRFMRPL